ncbi:MAG: hypothetical protein IKZ08_02515 [Bacteroidales bacterium]|nr:hypothetical protein [Bacteroidales bacterium]
MKKQHKITAIHNREGGAKGGWIGIIPDEDTYQKLKAGEVAWKESQLRRMSDVKIPADLFFRLMAMDTETSSLQAIISYLDTSIRGNPHEGRWVTESGEEISADVAAVQQWWDTCMKPELVRVFVSDLDAK